MISCVYCDSLEIKKREIIRNNLARAFPTNIPVVPGHILITPIRHIASIADLTTEELAAIFELREQLSSALKSIFGAEGFNYAWNEGKVAGQSIPHFHLHMLPRKIGDTGITEYEPRKFLYRPGERETTPEIELQAITNLIKTKLEN